MSKYELEKQLQDLEKEIIQKQDELNQGYKALAQLQELEKSFIASDGARFETEAQMLKYEDRLRFNQIFTNKCRFVDSDYFLILAVLAHHFECSDSLRWEGQLAIETDKDAELAQKHLKHVKKTLLPGVYYLWVEEYQGDNYGGYDSHYCLSEYELRSIIENFITQANNLLNAKF